MKGLIDLDDTTYIIDFDDVEGAGEGEGERRGKSKLAVDVLLLYIDYGSCGEGFLRLA